MKKEKQMAEEMRIRPEYGTVCGYTGKWFVECRFCSDDVWRIVYVTDSQADAQSYIDDMPDWVKNY